VSLAPHLTELVYAAGAGDLLVGVVEYSDYPAEARSLPRIGDAWRVDMERLLALQPDMVLTWASGTPDDVVERLDALKLTHREIATYRLADVPIALRTIGAIAGTPAVAEAAGRRIRSGNLRAAASPPVGAARERIHPARRSAGLHRERPAHHQRGRRTLRRAQRVRRPAAARAASIARGRSSPRIRR
jgi:iron complex transport system substrate-binding protein